MKGDRTGCEADKRCIHDLQVHMTTNSGLRDLQVLRDVLPYLLSHPPNSPIPTPRLSILLAPNLYGGAGMFFPVASLTPPSFPEGAFRFSILLAPFTYVRPAILELCCSWLCADCTYILRLLFAPVRPLCLSSLCAELHIIHIILLSGNNNPPITNNQIDNTRPPCSNPG